jgi:hypothetical protein
LLEAFSAQCQASHGWIRLGQLDCHPRRQTAHRVCPAPHGNRIATAQLSLRRCRRLQPTGGAEMPHGHGNMGYKRARAGFRKPGQSCGHALVSAHEGRAASQQCLDPGRPAGLVPRSDRRPVHEGFRGGSTCSHEEYLCLTRLDNAPRFSGRHSAPCMDRRAAAVALPVSPCANKYWLLAANARSRKASAPRVCSSDGKLATR